METMINKIDFSELSRLKEAIRDKRIELQTKHDTIDSDIEKINSKLSLVKNDNAIMERTATVFGTASSVSRESAKKHFEKIVTDALQYVTQSKDYSFVIEELKERQRVSYEFYIRCMVNGQESLQKPETSNGGGFIDTISIAMKYAYLQLFNDPKTMSGTLIMDEPGKMVSEKSSDNFARYIKFLGDEYGKQTIMITHNEKIASIADKAYLVERGTDGISTVREYNGIANAIEDSDVD